MADPSAVRAAVDDDLFGPDGDYYFQLLRLKHRSHEQVLADQIIHHACKGGCRVDVPIERSIGGSDNAHTLALSAASSLLNLQVEKDHILSSTGKRIYPVITRYRGWHLSVLESCARQFDAFILMWPIIGADALSMDIVGWCTRSELKKDGFRPRNVEPPTQTIPWFFLHRMPELKMPLYYNNSRAELNRRMLDTLTYLPNNLDSMVKQLTWRRA